jgi:hypothetical protein
MSKLLLNLTKKNCKFSLEFTLRKKKRLSKLFPISLLKNDKFSSEIKTLVLAAGSSSSSLFNHKKLLFGFLVRASRRT